MDRRVSENGFGVIGIGSVGMHDQRAVEAHRDLDRLLRAAEQHRGVELERTFLLIINECAFFLSAAGSFIGIRYLSSIDFKLSLKPLYSITTVLCILLTIQFTLLGIKLWPL